MRQQSFNLSCETEFERQMRENEEKGLTKQGYTRTFENTTTVFKLDGVEMTCHIEYDFGVPHAEFRGQPCSLTPTGYYSYFSRVDFSEFATIGELIDWIIGDRRKEAGGNKQVPGQMALPL